MNRHRSLQRMLGEFVFITSRQTLQTDRQSELGE
jgi:hypothetical protein